MIKSIKEQTVNVTEINVEDTPGLNQDKLETYQIQEKTGDLVFMGNDTVSSVGTKVITGIGFKPSYIEIFAQLATGGEHSYSNGYYNGTSTYTLWYYGDTGYMTGTYSTTDIIILYGNTSTNDVNAQLISLDNDGFTLNVSNADTTGYFIYKCYG